MLKDHFVKIARAAGIHDDYIDKLWQAAPRADQVFMNDFVARRACQIFLKNAPEARRPADRRN